ncbi:MAG: TrkH family potassium uptake protein [Candidatus Diapherotrites archaeon]|nr:TrkH family potassium uptake protein [Candidatus Diapherotrites archaeon]
MRMRYTSAITSLDDLKIIMREVGRLLIYTSISLSLPLLISLILAEGPASYVSYLFSMLIGFLLGGTFTLLGRTKTQTRVMHAMVSAAVIWPLFVGVAAIPFMSAGHITYINAYFETMSAVTTTGLSILSPIIETIPLSLVFWRTFISWVGGIGIIVLALTGVLKSYTHSVKLAEAEGREERLRPNIMNTLKEIWFIYVGFTIFGILLLTATGMPAWHAINYGMNAISTTGNVSNANGLVAFNSVWTHMALALIMILGAMSFAVHDKFFRKREFWAYWNSIEFRLLLFIIIVATLLMSIQIGFNNALFHAISGVTDGGFSNASGEMVAQWPDFTKLILILLMSIGGSVGSTAGGIKLIRCWVILKSLYWKLKESILPMEAYFQKKIAGVIVSDENISMIVFFALLYLLFLLIGTLVLTLYGYPMINSLFEVASAQGNAGISCGITQYEMAFGPKIMLIINMWVGRLEIIPILSIVGFALFFRQGYGRKA